MGEMSEFLPHC